MSDRFEKKLSSVLNISNKLFEDIDKQKNLENLWGVQLLDYEKSLKLRNEFLEKIDEIKTEASSECKTYIFFGDTSSGKSTTINALLKRKILPSSTGKTTRCFMEIMARNDSNEYLQIDDEITKHKIDLLKSKNESSSSGSIIKIYLNNEFIPFLKEKTVLIDSPGKDARIEENQNVSDDNKIPAYKPINKTKTKNNNSKDKNESQSIDDEILEKCKKSDVRILVVNATSWINDSTSTFIDQFKSNFANLNLFIVFTYMDVIHQQCETLEDKNNTENILKEKAIQLLRNREGNIDEKDVNNIFFLSPFEHLKGKTNETMKQDREKEFERFRKAFEEQMEWNFYSRRIENLFSLFSTLMENYQALLVEVKEKLPRIADQLVNQMRLVLENGDIKEIILKEKEKSYAIFKANGLIEICKETVENNENNLDEIEENIINLSSNESLNTKLLIDEETKKNQIKHKNIMILLNNNIKIMKTNIKLSIIDKIQQDNDQYLLTRSMLVTNLFYPLYIDRIKVVDVEDVEKLFIKMKKVILLSTAGVAVASSALLAIPCIITAGLAAPIAAATETAIVTIVASSLSAGAAGATAAGGVSAKICSIYKDTFERFWKKEERTFKERLDEFVENINNSYNSFLENMESHLALFYETLETDLATYQSDFYHVTVE